MNFIKKILLESFDYSEKNTSLFSWLYLLVYPYKGNMKIKDWKTDKRMGIVCSDAMNLLQNMNLIKITNESYVCFDLKKCKEILRTFFGEFTNMEDAEISGETFKKYNTKDYDISSIPFDIFNRDRYEQRVNTERFSSDYSIVAKWFKTYQRDIIGWNNNLNKFAGKVPDLLQPNVIYTLFRGVFLPKNNFNYKPGDLFLDDLPGQPSWTWSPSVAYGFACGKTHWMDNYKIQSGDTGLILKNTFDTKDLLLDCEYVEDKYPFDIHFSDELEVIVIPKNKKYKIYKVIKK